MVVEGLISDWTPAAKNQLRNTYFKMHSCLWKKGKVV